MTKYGSPSFAGLLLISLLRTAITGSHDLMASRFAAGSSPDARLILSSAEQALLADVKDGRFTKLSFAEAALEGSGVTDPARRQEYLRRLSKLEAQVTAAFARTATPSEKAAKLLAWLYDTGPLAPIAPRKKPRYVATQTSLAVLLDTGSYNCVSATVMYNVIGRRLGLDLRAVEVPTHVFSVLHVDNERVDVETTTPRGFNPSRDKAAIQEFSELTGFTYIPVRSRKKQRDVDEAALVGAIYYNRGVDALRSKRYPEAFRYTVLSLRLDALSTSAAANAEAALARWAADVARNGNMDVALDVIRQNLVWLADRTGEAKIILIAYQSHAEQFFGAQDWASAADLYVSASRRHQTDDKLAARLERNALAAYDLWAKPLIKAGRWQEAIAVYQRALKGLPDSKHLQRQLTFCKQRSRAPR